MVWKEAKISKCWRESFSFNGSGSWITLLTQEHARQVININCFVGTLNGHKCETTLAVHSVSSPWTPQVMSRSLNTDIKHDWVCLVMMMMMIQSKESGRGWITNMLWLVIPLSSADDVPSQCLHAAGKMRLWLHVLKTEPGFFFSLSLLFLMTCCFDIFHNSSWQVLIRNRAIIQPDSFLSSMSCNITIIV